MAQIPIAEKGLTCPLHKQDVSKVCHKCPWWTQVRGKNPQSNEEIARWGCAIGFFPLMMIELSQTQRQTGAAVESFRNEMVKVNTASLAALVALAQAEGAGALELKTINPALLK